MQRMEPIKKIIAREEHNDKLGHWFKVKYKDNGWGDENGVIDYCQNQNAEKPIKAGEIVEINDIQYKIKGVETFASCRVWTAGILVEPHKQEQ